MMIGTAVAETGTPWPVIVIGGLIIVAGLFAVRGEFANFRERRAQRRRARRGDEQ